MKKIFAAAALSLPAGAVRAEAKRPTRSSRPSPSTSKDAHVDEVTQTYIATGNVVLTRGT
jgi:lipopolysaccharide export system protein LptA